MNFSISGWTVCQVRVAEAGVKNHCGGAVARAIDVHFESAHINKPAGPRIGTPLKSQGEGFLQCASDHRAGQHN